MDTNEKWWHARKTTICEKNGSKCVVSETFELRTLKDWSDRVRNIEYINRNTYNGKKESIKEQHRSTETRSMLFRRRSEKNNRIQFSSLIWTQRESSRASPSPHTDHHPAAIRNNTRQRRERNEIELSTQQHKQAGKHTVVAHEAWMNHLRPRSVFRPSLSVSCFTGIA